MPELNPEIMRYKNWTPSLWNFSRNFLWNSICKSCYTWVVLISAVPKYMRANVFLYNYACFPGVFLCFLPTQTSDFNEILSQSWSLQVVHVGGLEASPGRSGLKVTAAGFGRVTGIMRVTAGIHIQHCRRKTLLLRASWTAGSPEMQEEQCAWCQSR